jgi:membrane protein implicated in regulation of membrane protease activity
MVTEAEVAIALVLAGVVLLVIEALSPGAFLLVPATILIIIGILGLIYPGLLFSYWSPIIAVVLFVPMTYVTIKIYQRLAPPAPPQTTVATSLVGQKGVVTKTVQPDSLTGKVRIDHDIWSATAPKEIKEGTQVVVKSSEGVHVTVEEFPDKGAQ